MTKTNVMRLLTAAGVAHVAHNYPVDARDLSGEHAAAQIGLPAERVFKTLVLVGDRSGPFVCCVPSNAEVDSRKAAKAAGVKGCDMLPMKDLLAVTGYLRGGCSPIGMKKKYPSFVDSAALRHETITVSAGVRGTVVELPPQALIAFIGATVAELTKG